MGGALGMGGEYNRLKPGKVDLPRCLSIAASSVSMAISHRGQLFVWGKSAYIGQLGAMPQDGFSPVNHGGGSSDNAFDLGVPRPLEWLKSRQVCYVTCGIAHAVAFLDDG